MKKDQALTEQHREKPAPAYFRNNYPYKAEREAIADLNELEDATVYEVKCENCEMSFRSQGQNIRSMSDKMNKTGCIGCGTKEFIVRRVNMSIV